MTEQDRADDVVKAWLVCSNCGSDGLDSATTMPIYINDRLVDYVNGRVVTLFKRSHDSLVLCLRCVNDGPNLYWAYDIKTERMGLSLTASLPMARRHIDFLPAKFDD